MWYLVNLPNRQTSAVQCSEKANGQEILNKVCQDLGIICETDYFGLLYASSSSNSSLPNEKQWINLRNPLNRRNSTDTLLLDLRIKFWVPGHLILQENVRDIFFMQARQILLDGHLKANNWNSAAKLSALLAHADGIKFQPSYLLEHCSPIKEIIKQRKEEIAKEPTELRNKRRRISKRKSSESDKEDQAQNNSTTSTSTSQCENVGDCERMPSVGLYNYLNYIVESIEEIPDTPNSNSDEAASQIPDNFLVMIAKEHEKLCRHNMTIPSAKYWLLEEISLLKGFGEEMFEGILMQNEQNLSNRNQQEVIRIGVSPHGLTVNKIKKQENFNIPFTAVESAKSIRRLFHLTYLDHDQTSTNLVIKFSSHRIAGAIYRALTEKHSFYSCETVRSAVTTQFIRDLKGTIISMFNEDTELGKRYVFDIQRTCREVYDSSRRFLHQRGIEIKHYIPAVPDANDDSECTSSPNQVTKNSEKFVDKKIAEALTCKICMDQQIDTLFLPCGHFSFCNNCASKCESTCPLCRAEVTSINKVYLPSNIQIK